MSDVAADDLQASAGETVVRPILMLAASGLVLYSLHDVSQDRRRAEALGEFLALTQPLPGHASFCWEPPREEREAGRILRELLATPNSARGSLQRLIVLVRAAQLDAAGLSELPALRATGVRIAIDVSLDSEIDARARRILPDYLRVGPCVAGAVADRPQAEAQLARIVAEAWEMGAAVISNGVSSVRDLGTVGRCGVHLAEGRLFGPPAGLRQFADSRFAAQWIVAAHQAAESPSSSDSEEE